MYGLCQVHQEIPNSVPPFRPILSAINTPKFLIPILEPLTKNEYVLKEPFSFSEEIRNSNMYMATFDVVSLSTNISLDGTIEICVNKLYPEKNMKVNGLRRNEFRNLLLLAIYFSQIDGVGQYIYMLS